MKIITSKEQLIKFCEKNDIKYYELVKENAITILTKQIGGMWCVGDKDTVSIKKNVIVFKWEDKNWTRLIKISLRDCLAVVQDQFKVLAISSLATSLYLESVRCDFEKGN